jgi:8-oxo-dGTP diphosphatase
MDENGHVGSAAIRLRAGVAVVQDGRILLVPHYDTDAGPVQWCIPGGRLEPGEGLEETARREFEEETGLRVQGCQLLDVSEVVLPEKGYHSITITFSGSVEGGVLRPELDHPYGEKRPRWISREELGTLACHPQCAIEKAFGMHQDGRRPSARGESICK